MIVATKLDEYWKTLTVAEAMKDYSSLRLTCACGRITDYPFVLLLQRRGVNRDTSIGNIRFRCKSCGGKDIKIGVHSQRGEAGYLNR